MINQERLREVENKSLFKGSGPNVDHACIMQMVSYVAGEKWSDSPKCACPILTRYAIRINDVFNDEHRQKLKPFIIPLVGTRSTGAIQIKRKQLMMWRNVTVVYPLLLDLIKMPELAEKLRAFGNNAPDMKLAANLLKENKEAIWKARSANAYANANAYAYADADADANAYADADADAYADAYAYADANALRANIADAAIETLRLACEIKEEKKNDSNS